MNRDLIAALYCDLKTDGTSLYEVSDQLYDNTRAAKMCADRFAKLLDGLAMDSGLSAELEESHAATAGAYEEQGFINGFRFGMMMAREIQGEPPVIIGC